MAVCVFYPFFTFLHSRVSPLSSTFIKEGNRKRHQHPDQKNECRLQQMMIFYSALLNSKNSSNHIPVFTVFHTFIAISLHVLTLSLLKIIAGQQIHAQDLEGSDWEDEWSFAISVGKIHCLFLFSVSPPTACTPFIPLFLILIFPHLKHQKQEQRSVFQQS